MYLKILVAVNESFNSELAAHHAVAIAASNNSELVVLAVDVGEVNPENLSSSVNRIVNHAKKNGVNARGIVRKGELIKTILATIYAEHADLLVTATRQSDYRLFVRSTAQELMQTASCSVIAVKPAGIALKGKSLLLPVERKQYALDEQIMLTAGLAKFYNFSVEILNVIEQRQWYELPWQTLYKMRSHGEESLMPILNAMKEQGIEAEVRAVVAEKSKDAILKEVAIGKHSILLIAAGRVNILKQVVAGNPMEQLLSKSLCDVLIWRPRQ